MNARGNLIAAVLLFCAAVAWMHQRQKPIATAVSSRKFAEACSNNEGGRVASPRAKALKRGERSAPKRPDGSPNAEQALLKGNAHPSDAPSSHVEHSNGEASIGVRLSRNVRLPAVSFMKDADFPASSEIAMAMCEIENEFYRELLGRAARTKDDDASAESDFLGVGAIEADESGEKTVTVGPGAAVERAMDRSDEAFRSLFGNDSYNRRKMEGSMELGLSNETTGSGN